MAEWPNLRDHAANRDNSFAVGTHEKVLGWCVINERTGQVAQRPSGRRYWGLTKDEAEAMAAKLNRRAKEKHICKQCRHKRYADEIKEGRCAECRTGSKSPTAAAG